MIALNITPANVHPTEVSFKVATSKETGLNPKKTIIISKIYLYNPQDVDSHTILAFMDRIHAKNAISSIVDIFRSA